MRGWPERIVQLGCELPRIRSPGGITAVMPHRLVLWLFRLLPSWLAKWGIFLLKRKYVIGAVAIVPNERGECLFLHHTYRRKRPWRLPGGLKERREHAFATVVRELQEEANITVRPLCVVGVTQSDITFDIVVLCECVRVGAFAPNAEIDGLVWEDPFAAPFEVPEDQRQLIRLAFRLRRAPIAWTD